MATPTPSAASELEQSSRMSFIRGRITSFVSLQAGIYFLLNFEVKVSPAHLYVLIPTLQKGKQKVDINDVSAAGRKDVGCQSRKWRPFLLYLI
jgi:hypothetical protein